MKISYRQGYLKQPTYDDLMYTKRLWEDEETMAFNKKWGGTIVFPKEEWMSFYERYCIDDPHYVYYHIYNNNHEFIGEVSSRSSDLITHHLNIKVLASMRGHQHGYHALNAYLEYLFNTPHATIVVDDVASDNQGAIHLLKKCGFIIEKENSEIVYMRLDKHQFDGHNK
ncbi:GNAT family N-acetyltransferase [Candidatus Xianfuyuplasma coldseepsis]|uniref:GNAT family N-acetyltransferase n=1 Tax=Candidatus Xianfuyuplasma coldseepsis TaxID=2782163 RepID=A0A7L7KTY6_9MOLU|nr:GNAT family protein [Xianfuyuplasma coldseepsis]QMS85464.1 GNAT family N-acetyltransferase [Xianfuyuplasma coldseepsis]